LQTFQGSSATGGFPNETLSGSTGTGISPIQAARFLTQATFGPTLDSIDRVRLLGYAPWITEQIALAPTLHSTYAQAIADDLFTHQTDLTYSHSDLDHFLFGNNLMTAFARAAIQGEDQLRQRTAFALSQILVTSRRDAQLENRVIGMASYYDIFVRNAFGNRHLGTISGFVIMGHHACGGLGAWIGGIVFDAAGAYDTAFMVMLVSSVIAVWGTLALGRENIEGRR
jgi:hypothetical protein